MRITKALIEQLNAIPITDLFERYHIKWERGRNFKRPWGNTATGRTPSCRYYPDTNSVGDFGTHKGGGPIHFVKLMEECSFQRACELLMSWYSIEALPEFSYKSYLDRLNKKQQDKDRQFTMIALGQIYRELFESDQLVNATILFCEKSLLSQEEFMQRMREAIRMDTEEYLISAQEGIREILEENIAFTKSVATKPNLNFQAERKFTNRDTLSGMAVDVLPERWKEQEGRYVFPVFYPTKFPVGFSGRALTPHIVKYLTHFDYGLEKDEVMYGLDVALPYIVERNYVIVVEGILDVLRCREAGYPNTVAPLSTSLSEFHVGFLKAFTENFLLVYDGDEGGQAATEVAKRNLDKYRLLYEVVKLPDEFDPDSLGKVDINLLSGLLKSQWKED